MRFWIVGGFAIVVVVTKAQSFRSSRWRVARSRRQSTSIVGSSLIQEERRPPFRELRAFVCPAGHNLCDSCAIGEHQTRLVTAEKEINEEWTILPASPLEHLGIESEDRFDEANAGLDRPEDVAVGDVHLDAAADIACM